MISELINIFVNTPYACVYIMVKSDFIKEVALTTGVDEATTKKVFDGVAKVMQQKLIQGIDLKLKDFMNLTLEISPKRKNKNLQTGNIDILPARFRVKIVLPRYLRERIAQKTVYAGTN